MVEIGIGRSARLRMAAGMRAAVGRSGGAAGGRAEGATAEGAMADGPGRWRVRLWALLNARALISGRAGNPGDVAYAEDDRLRLAARGAGSTAARGRSRGR